MQSPGQGNLVNNWDKAVRLISQELENKALAQKSTPIVSPAYNNLTTNSELTEYLPQLHLQLPLYIPVINNDTAVGSTAT